MFLYDFPLEFTLNKVAYLKYVLIIPELKSHLAIISTAKSNKKGIGISKSNKNKCEVDFTH